MTGPELIANLRRSGVEVRAENGELRLNAPKGILTSDIRALLLQHKAEILAILEQESAEREAAEIPVLGPRDRNAQLLQSFAQQRLWFLHQLDPLTHTYNMTPAFRLRGPLDPELMERCLNEILRRHEVLRTRLASVDGVAVQKVEQDCSLHLSRLDLSDTPEVERWSTARRVLSEHAQHPFALADELLIRAVLVRLAPEEHVLGLVVHHGVFDGWSVGVLLAELSELYPAFEAGRASPLPNLTLQYGDYSTWQRDWLEGGELERQGQFWADHLGGSLSALDLPGDRARPPFFTGHGATFPWDIDEDVVRGLSALGRNEHATLFMSLLAAFGVVLYRYSRNPDIIIGTPVANRNHAELEGLIGLFANTLALRIDLSGQPSFRELLRRVRASCIGAYGHADMPFERIVQDLQVERDPSRTPVFQAMLGLEGTGERRANLGKVVVTEFDTDEDVARADLSIWLRPRDGGLSGSVEYCTDLFELETTRRVILSFETLLRQVVADPDKPIDQIDLLDSAERHRLVQEWNSTERPLSVPSALSRIRDQTAHDPARVAVSTGGGEQLSYGALWETSGRVASHLVSQGVERGSIVGVSVSRCPDMLAALLGIWRAGAAYLPLDPEFPEDRLAFMVADSRASYIVTDGQAAVPETQAHLIDIGSIPSSVDDSALPQIEGDDLAYIIYTSGSTGQPKGVEVTHRNLANFIQSMSKEPGLDEDAVLCAVTTLSFDIAGLELWLPLWLGARVVLADDEQSRDGEWLSELLETSGATVMQATPSTWRMLLDAGWEGGLKKVLCGGEAFPQDLVGPLLERADEVWNLYGPTETTVWSTAYRVETEPDGSVPIGRPIDNTRVYVVDEHGALQPPGAPGELWIGGLGVTPGYHDRSDLTAERFLRSPFVDGDRVYRTGDLVRWRSDGLLEHLGRMDQQVKVHGFRIELGEIEAALAAHEAVRQAVATVHGHGADARLVGHVVVEDGADVLGSELRVFLRKRLPDYMVPGVIMEIDELPLTPNGKVDRKALPSPLESVAQREFVAPQTQLEKQIADIWCRILEVERVGLHDNFFELGGHSLLAIRMLTELRRELGRAPSPAGVFVDASLSTFSESVEAVLQRSGPVKESAVLEEVDPSTLPDEIRPSFAQEAVWYIENTGQAPTAYHLGTARRVRGPFDLASFETAAQRLVEAHEALRFRFPEKDGLPLLTVVDDADVKLVPEDLGSDPDVLSARLKRFSTAPYDLSEGPLIRFAVFRVDEDEHVVGLGVHHIAVDGISLDSLWDELLGTYRVLVEGGSPSVSQPDAAYRLWAMRQRERFEDLNEEGLAFWKSELAECPSPTGLHPDRPASMAEAPSGASLAVRIPEALFDAVTRLSQEGITPFNAILSSLQLALARHSGVSDVAVGVPTRIDPEGFRSAIDPVGLYINSVVMRQKLNPDETFQDLLLANRETIGRAMEHRDVPFSRLVQALRPERGHGGTPFFQVLLSGQHGESGGLGELGEGLVEPVSVERSGAQAELALYLRWGESAAGLHVDYVADLFDHQTIEQFVASMLVLLQNGLEQPRTRSVDLPAISEPTLRLLTEDRNATARELSAAQIVTEIHDRVQERPDQVAVAAGDRTLAYGALWEASGRVASHLVSQGVERGSIVGVSVSRCPDMLAALLGIWRAGAAYLPLDPEFPEDRLAFMVADSRASYIVTDGQAAVPETQAHLIDIGSIPSSVDDSALPQIEGDDLAYIIYTSGSTGQPKGVEVTHRNLANFIQSMSKEPGLDEDAVLCAVTTLSFDIAGLELWLPLWLGARVVLADDEQSRDGEWLSELLETSGATVMQATPSTWRMLLDAGWEGGLKKALCGGEAFPQDLVAPLLERADEVWNLYGPTETTVWSTAYRVETEPDGSVPIGRPIDNTRVYVVDEHGALQPPGAPGELWIGGLGVTPGYHDRSDLTAERFLRSPFVDGDRVYRTGDLVRWRSDGLLEHLGRMDQQVKVHGFRIELGEIEAALAAHEAVRQAVATVHGHGADARLVGHVVVEDGEVSGADLRGFLSTRLPGYMVPGVIMELDELPLTPNGKVDRKALPNPLESVAQREFVAPQTQLEKQIADIWCRILEVERVGLHDNFFELGGHSLLAIRMLTELRRELGRAPSPAGLFVDASLSTFSESVEAVLQRSGPVKESAVLEEVDPSTLPDEIRPSFAQEAVWYIENTGQAPTAYHLGTARRVRGPFDLASFETAAQRLVEAHEALRFRFPEKDGLPLLTVVDDADVKLVPEDLGSDPDVLSARLKRFSTAPYDLSEGPLIRFAVFRVDEDEHVVGLGVHHIAVDGISLDSLWDELLGTYRVLVEGGSPSVSQPDAAYRLWAMRQRERFEDLNEEGLAFWKSELAECPSPTGLHPDRPASMAEAPSGASLAVRIPEALFDAVTRLSQEGITPFNAILSSLQLALARHSGVSDVAVGVPTRIDPEGFRSAIDPVGLYINSVVMRQKLNPDETFQDLLLANRETIGRAMEHRDVPFSRLVQALRPERGHGGTPFFQVLLSGQHGESGGLGELGEGLVEPVSVERSGAQAELALYLRWGESAAGLHVDYVADLFDHQTIEQFVASMLVLLQNGLEQPRTRSVDLPAISEPTLRLLTEDRNATARELSAAQIVTEIHDRVQERPDQVAVAAGDRTLAYGALWEASGRVASHLVSQGVERGSIVGVSVSRCPDMLAALLGIWRAGAAYLPLDPEFPEDRLAFMVADSRASYIVTDGQAAVPETQAHLIDIGSIPSSVDDSALPQIEGDDLAYIIYTSGSTGQPKGVEVTHRNLANFIQSMSKEPGLDEDAVLCAVTTLSFDIAGLELWLPLWLGARVVLADDEQSRDGEWLSELLETSGATVMQATPSTWRMLLDAGWEGGLKKALCGGEAFPQDLVAPLLERADEVWNLYGPTETTVWSTAYRVETEPDGSVPIGRPIDNTRVYVVDEHGALLPPGAPGELWIGGLGVTRGYHERSDLTAERFLWSPFVDGDRVYRTGDLVRWRSDGLLEHLGRMDQQVQVHGFRIELGEIETALAAHEAVRQAVATVHGHGADARLVGHVVVEDGADVLGSELRTFLSTRLPVYMVPGLIVELDELPLTPNGKVDRKALPNPLESVAQREFVAPQTQLEKQIADIWCGLLEVERVGVHDNFFELGGHSLLAIRAVALMSTESGCRVDPRSVFFQSLGQLASSLDG